ncbi:MAG: TetR family transcriptional regulator [Microbacteriaceae bacterium]|jgi:AcrR family transcriptional regulator|nr:TetR family transcriptional regulator [Microbacteriaceae bacterium]
MSLDIAQQGLRERKRIATRRAIESAAINLVVEKGLENVTIDEISHRADVSPRTFFNYFASKEAALLGESPELPVDGSVARFVDGELGSSALEGLGELISTASEDSREDAETHTLRFALLRQYPQLFTLRMTAMRDFEEELASVVAERLRHDEPTLDDDARRSKAKLITLVAFGVIRHSWSCWAENESAMTLSERMKESFAQLPGILSAGAA